MATPLSNREKLLNGVTNAQTSGKQGGAGRCIAHGCGASAPRYWLSSRAFRGCDTLTAQGREYSAVRRPDAFCAIGVVTH